MIKKSINYVIKHFKKSIWNLVINSIISSKVMPDILRFMCYKLFRMNIHTHKVSGGAYFKNKKIYIGKGTFINYEVFFDNTSNITIEENCDIAYKVTFCTATHEVGSSSKRAGEGHSKPILIESGTWIGANSSILPGVTVGEGCIIASGSVVVDNCEPNSLYGGIPAKKIKKLPSRKEEKVGKIYEIR